MLNIKKITPKHWSPIKQDLENRLDNVWRYKRILRTDKHVISVEGGKVIISFNIQEGKAYVHNKCSRYSGGYAEISLLSDVENILKEWAITNFKEDI